MPGKSRWSPTPPLSLRLEFLLFGFLLALMIAGAADWLTGNPTQTPEEHARANASR